MFGTRVSNPLYYLLEGAATIAYVLATLAFVAAFILLWKGFKKAGLCAFGGSFAMFVVAFNDAATWKADSYWVQADALDGTKHLVSPVPSDTAVLLSVVALVALGWLLYRSVTGEKLLTSGGLFVALIGSAVVASDMIALAYGYGSQSSENVFVVNNHLWSVLFIASVAYAAVAMVVLAIRGYHRIKNRAKLDMVTGTATVPHPNQR